ncbi:MAG TPA: carbohydrate binding domain-containing protein [Pyrinomonadaceae bacterium]|nr:carbohydrate binding domain-containing protein [Pyrinomonadaceae bacterium]
MIRVNLRPIRVAIAVLSVAICLFLIQLTARIGFSRLLTTYALTANSIPAADEAVHLSPSDPEAHRARATVLNRLGMHADAAMSFEAATRLRDRDDYLWLELGNTREELSDTQGALAALDQAVRWAPYYAHTHWQRGNLLLRMGRTAESFAELRQAAAANRTYLPNLIDLAWAISRENVQTAKRLIGIKDDKDRLALVRFLANKGKGGEVIDQLRLLSAPLSKKDHDELVRLLFAAKDFKNAYELWVPSMYTQSTGAVFNRSFEDSTILNEPGFGGWVRSASQNKVKLAIDVNEKLEGAKSLQISFEGSLDPGVPLLSQTVLVEPAKTYPLSFGVKTKDLITGAPLIMTVYDAVSNQLLGKSENLPSGTTSWTKLQFDFTTLATSRAAVIRLQRSNCDSSPCPIFGTMWLDEVSLVHGSIDF